MSDTARILVVDDDPIILRLVSRLLREAGYEIVPAASGSEALRLTEEEAPDLVMLDVVLPDIDGIEVCQRIKDTPASQDTYVILLSGRRTESESRATGLEAGADGYITRPVSNRELLARVEAMLRLKRTEEKLRQSEKRYRSLFNSIRDAILVADTDRNIIDCNPAFSDLFGYTLGEIEGKQTHAVYESREEFRALGEALKDHVGDPNFLFTVHYQKRSGEVFPGETNVFYLRNDKGEVTGFIGLIRDVTERQRMERKLRESRNKLRGIVEASPLPIFLIDPDGVVQMWNAAAERVFGWREDEVIGEPLPIVSPSEEDEFAELRSRVLRGESLRAIEIQRQRKDGEMRDVALSTAAVRDASGRVVGIMAVVDDVTERKRMERTLRESEERYRELVEKQGEGIGIVDPDERFVFANPAACEIFGVAREGLVGRSLRAFVDDEAYATIREETGLRRGGEESSYELEITRPDGEKHTMLVTATPRRDEDGTFTGTFAVFRDITARKRAEAALEWSERKFREIFDESPIAIELYDAEGRLMDANKACLEMFGAADVDEVRGFRLLEDPNLPEEARRELERGNAVRYESRFDFRLINEGNLYETSKSGTMYLDVRITPLRLGAIWSPGGYLVQAQDITRRKLADEALREYAERLEEMVEERAEELREAQTKLLRNEKLAMLGQLAGSINHELRGPLGNIKNGAYFLDMALDEPDKDVDETLELLQQEVNRAETIVSSLLNFVRTRESQREPVDVNGLLDDLLSHAEIPKGIRISQDMGKDLPMISADPEQLRQVFRNLISNAVEAMPEGGHLTVKTSEVSQELAEPGRHVVVSVSDTGEGVPEENQERIFEPLFSTKSEGVGLGLALTCILVEAHDGTIEVESEEGEGSTFIVRLPLEEEKDDDV